MKFKLFLTIVILTTIRQNFSMTPIDQKNLNNQLFEVAKYGHATRVELLLARGADINAKDNHGETPLHKAARDGYVANGDTPLHEAASNRSTSTIELLLAHGADINVINNYRSTPLREAAMKGHRTIVTLLKNYQALLKQAQNPTKALLKMAIEHGYYSLVKQLLQKGLKPEISDLKLAKEKWQTAEFKESYKAIGRLLVAYFRLRGELKATENSENIEFVSYWKNKLIAYLSKPRTSTQGPISKTGIVGLYGLPETIAQEIAQYQ